MGTNGAALTAEATAAEGTYGTALALPMLELELELLAPLPLPFAGGLTTEFAGGNGWAGCLVGRPALTASCEELLVSFSTSDVRTGEA